MVRKLTNPPYTINPRLLKRFDERQTIFGRMLNDKKARFYKKGMYDNVKRIIAANRPGYTRIGVANELAAWTVYDYFQGAFSRKKLTDSISIMPKPKWPKYRITSMAALTRQIKATAKIYGASAVGICKVNKQWIYTYNRDGKPIKIPARHKTAIVVAVAMETRAIKTSPAITAGIETAVGYSRSAFCVASLAEFIRYLGFDAISMGNDSALSIPLAIDAGLGELGRNGLLITPAYGPCVRLAKVFTDLPLIPDKPISFGVTKLCENCRRCAVACAADAIQKDEKPSLKISCPSNNPGVIKWTVNHDRCYEFWIKNGGDCSNCIAACPFDPRTVRRVDG